MLHDVEIGQDPNPCLLSAKVSHNGALLKKQVFCLDYCATFSLFATVSAAGSAPFPKTSEHPGWCNFGLQKHCCVGDFLYLLC